MRNDLDQLCAVCLGLLCLTLFGCSSDENSASDGAASLESVAVANNDPRDNDPLPRPVIETGLLKVYSPDSQATVLIDGQPAVDETGQRLSPPCEVVVEKGTRTVTLTQTGFQDRTREVFVSSEQETTFEPLMTASEQSISTSVAPLFTLPVGEAYLLASVNSRGAELDPYLSADGLSLWFAGDRSEGKAIYSAVRPSIWHDFSEPEILLLTRSSSLPASPSVTGNSLTIYYAQPDEAQIWSLSRRDFVGRFAEKQRALFDLDTDALWTSAQVLPDDLRLYWTVKTGDKLAGFAVVRESVTDKFSKPIPYDLPGLIPALSADGLRQYTFDGKTLKRSRRASISDQFQPPIEILKLDLTDYEEQPGRRQFSISENEQWMIYSQGRASAADLFLVRLSDAPGWGLVSQGKSIPAKAAVGMSEMTAPKEPKSTKAEPVEKIDPRTLPLPLTQYDTKWRAALANRDYPLAKKLTDEALSQAELSEFSQLLQTDHEIRQTLEQFWSLADRALINLKPGDSFSFGTTKATFQSYADGIVKLKAGTKDLERPLLEIPRSTVVNLISDEIETTDAEAQATIAHLLIFDKEAQSSLALSRLEDFPAEKERLIDRASAHALAIAKLEFARNNLAAGLEAIQQITAQFPDSTASLRAKELERELYAKTDWTPVGDRKWEMSAQEYEFRATDERVSDSFLKSPRSVGNFDLQFEWRANGKLGQGGVYFHYPGEGRVYNRAFKIHLADDATNDKYSTGSLFGIEGPTENAAKPVGEWNTTKISVRESDVTVWINGKEVLDTLAIAEDISESGYIMFDGISGGIAYRRIILVENP